MREIDRDVWLIAADDPISLQCTLSASLDRYARVPGLDDLVRNTPGCIGDRAYATLRDVLLEKSRKNIWYCDHGWHLELRMRLWTYVLRELQRQLVTNGKGTERLTEDLLAHDVGV